MVASTFASQFQVLSALVLRELIKLKSEPMRMLGMIIQPFLVWLVFSFGFDRGFSQQVEGGHSFLEYFFPGVVVMTILFGCVFSSMTIIEDRVGGFLQSALSTSASRALILAGKSVGVTCVTLIQMLIVLLAGSFFTGAAGDWNIPLLAYWFLVSCAALVPLNLSAALWLNSNQSYHAFMGMILLPAWALSGAVFPVDEGAFHYVALLNPMTYMVEGFRFALSNENGGSWFVVSQLWSGLVLLLLGSLGLWLGVLTLKKSAGK